MDAVSILAPLLVVAGIGLWGFVVLTLLVVVWRRWNEWERGRLRLALNLLWVAVALFLATYPALLSAMAARLAPAGEPPVLAWGILILAGVLAGCLHWGGTIAGPLAVLFLFKWSGTPFFVGWNDIGESAVCLLVGVVIGVTIKLTLRLVLARRELSSSMRLSMELVGVL